QPLVRDPVAGVLGPAALDAVPLWHAAVPGPELHVPGGVGIVHEARRAHDLDARRVAVDQEEGLATADLRQEDEKFGAVTARDEPLLSVQHPLVAVADGGGLQRAEVGARPRLGDRPRRAGLAAEDGHHVALELIGARRLVELPRAPAAQHEPEAVRRLARLLL